MKDKVEKMDDGRMHITKFFERHYYMSLEDYWIRRRLQELTDANKKNLILFLQYVNYIDMEEWVRDRMAVEKMRPDFYLREYHIEPDETSLEYKEIRKRRK